MDRTKVTLSKDNGNKLFQIFSNGQMLSTGLNVMYGKRSSGKSYTLNKIAEKYGDKGKYIQTENLKALLKELIEVYQNLVVENAIKKEANDIIKDVRSALQRKSAAPRIPDIDLYHMLVNEVKRRKFTDIVIGLKQPCVINTDKVGHFTIKVHTRLLKKRLRCKDCIR